MMSQKRGDEKEKKEEKKERRKEEEEDCELCFENRLMFECVLV